MRHIAILCVLAATGLSAREGTTPEVPTATVFPADDVRFTGSVDSNSPVVWDLVDGEPRVYVLTSIAGRPSRAEGRTILDLGEPTPVDIQPWPDGGVWMEAIIPDVDGTWYGFYHLERVPTETCPDTSKTAPQIGVARSGDRGLSWTDLGIIIDIARDTFDCDTRNVFFVGGVGDLSVMLDPARRDLFIFYSQYGRDPAQQGVGVARLAWADRDAPAGTVTIWNDGAWLPPVRGGGDADTEPRLEYPIATSLFPTGNSWHDGDTLADAFWGPSVHWNTYLSQYVMLLNRARDTSYTEEGIYVSFNPRLDDPTGWSSPVRILEGGSWYPQVVGITDGVGTDKEGDQIVRFFMSGRSEYVIQFDR